MTKALFRENAYQRSCQAVITSIGPEGVELDATVFYPQGGGQAGDSGWLTAPTGERLRIIDTRKSKREGAGADDVLHIPEPGHEALWSESSAVFRPGLEVAIEIDWPKRHRHMRFHTSTHLLCALISDPVNGCSITESYARLDFDRVDPLDKDELNERLRALIDRQARVSARWISDEALLAQPDLVRTMSVKPPLGYGSIRLLEIEGIDLQPCGGTHVASLREIGRVVVTKIEKKSARTRRVVLGIEDSIEFTTLDA